MAKENHDGIAETLSITQLSSSPNPKPIVNLQLSLGGFYDKTPKSTSATTLPTSFANPPNSVLKRPLFEENDFLQKEVAAIKITREFQVITKAKNQDGGSAPQTSLNVKPNEVNTLVSPRDIPVFAAQSAVRNPAFQRALSVIKSKGILRTPRSTNFTGNPHAAEGFGSGSQRPTLYQTFKNENPMGTPINTGTDKSFFVAPKQPGNLNLVAPANFRGAIANGIPNLHSQVGKFASPFHGSLATMDQLPHWSADGSLIMYSGLAPYAPQSSANISFPYPTAPPVMPQNATGFNKPQIPPNPTPTSLVPPFVPIPNSTNANGNSFILPLAPSQPFAGAGGRPIPLQEIINSSKVHDHMNPMNQPDYPCKRAKHDNPEDTGETDHDQLQLMKQLPIVITTGGNPNGKKIEGLLYKYGSDEEVIIICVCHGCFFSPEEFVKHAGGGDGQVENPRQQICVLDYNQKY